MRVWAHSSVRAICFANLTGFREEDLLRGFVENKPGNKKEISLVEISEIEGAVKSRSRRFNDFIVDSKNFIQFGYRVLIEP